MSSTTTISTQALVEQLLDKALADFPEATVAGITYSMGYANGIGHLYRYDAAAEDHVQVARVRLTVEVESC